MKQTGLAIFFILLSCNIFGAEIYVSSSGNDRGQGTAVDPYATANTALRAARELRRLGKVSVDEPVRIIMAGGSYPMCEPLFVRPEDSGTSTSPTVIESSQGAVLSGGVQVRDWKKQGRFWCADVPEFNGNRLVFRQMWVNGVKAVRARSVEDFEQMERIRSNDKQNEILWIPASAVRGVEKSQTLELVIHQMWAVANLRVKSIEIRGDSAAVKFHNPESRIQFEHPWPQPMVKQGFNSAFYLTNSIELVDCQGEWFHDSKQNKIYYIPRAGEDMNRAEVVVPALETLVQVCGTIDRPVKHVQFKGIGFEYTTWTRPSLAGHVPLQAGMWLIDGYKLRPAGVPGNNNIGIENQAWIGRQPACVMVSGAQHTVFEGCRFEHLGACGIDFLYATQFDSVVGCLFRDIAGNGVQIGKMSDVGFESHLPYDPSDEREICSNQLIANNLITDVTNEDWGCVGIVAGFVRDIRIEHNEICEVSYSGISLGWGWTKTVNCMRNNRVYANYIHHYGRHLYDVAGIYTLSVQPKTSITQNRIETIYKPSYVHDPNHWFYLYTDEGSSFITVKDNWCEGEKFLQNANGPGNTWENNGPMVDPKIKQAAGLEPQYEYLKKL